MGETGHRTIESIVATMGEPAAACENERQGIPHGARGMPL
jgi:hypothetical protein